MPAKGRAHFGVYTESNRVKHAILTNYLRAYLRALSRRVDAYYYIDGFAGAGTYGAEHAGSPIYALQLLAEQSKPATASFVESDPKLFEQLRGTVQHASAKLWSDPTLRCGEFSEHVDEVLHHPIRAAFRRVATFAFIDPCGLKGLYLDDLATILKLSYAECLVFLNYEGLARWLGAVRAGSHARVRIERFFGTAKAAADALSCLDASASSREASLLDTYVRALHENSGATFVLPFRFRAAERNRTSHYLIHLTQHRLGFKIMKEVMRGESSESDDVGSFGFIPDEELTAQRGLFRPNMERTRSAILEELRDGPRPVRLFVDDWPSQPSDMLAPSQYKELLLTLEREQRIGVYDPTTGLEAPAARRRRTSRGEATLGERYEIRLRR